MSVHRYDRYSTVHNFCFHPLHRKAEQQVKTVLAVITNLFLAMLTAGLWEIAFLIVNRLDSRKVKVLNKTDTPGVNTASASVFPKTKKAKKNEPTETVPTIVSQTAFGKELWEKYFGEVGEVPKLPPRIKEILEADCKIFPGKKIHETHLFVLVPEKVGGEPLTLNLLDTLVTNPKNEGHPSHVRLFSHFVSPECRAASSPSHWVLISKDVVEGSRNKSYEEQVELVKRLAQDTEIPYEVPMVRDVAVSVFMHHAHTGIRLFVEVEPATFTRCQDCDTGGDDQVLFGNFSNQGVVLDSDESNKGYEEDGVAVSARFF